MLHALPVIVALTLGQYGPWVGVGISRPMYGGSTYSGSLDWSRSWATDWGASAAGMPEPTIACEADADSFDCVGATATPVGSPTTTTAAGYPVRDAVSLATNSDWFELGSASAQSGSFTVSGSIKPDNVSGTKQIVGHHISTSQGWALYLSNANLTIVVCKANASCTTSIVGTMTAGAWHAFAVSYIYLTDGTSQIGANVSGTAGTETTNAVGPPQQSTSGIRIANDSEAVPSTVFVGSMASINIWSGTGASVAQRAILVASQQARLASKPVGALATVSSGATKAWDATGVVHSLPANSLAPSPTGAGMEIWSAAAHSNALPTSTTAGWTGAPASANDVGVDTADTAANATGPDGSATSATTITAGVGGAEHYVTQNYTGTAVAWVDSVDLKVEAGWAFVSPDGGTSGLYVNRATCAAGTSVTLTSSSVALRPGNAWCRVQVVKTLTAATYAMRVYIAEADNDKSFVGTEAETLTFYAPMAQVGTVAGPIVVSAGTPITGAADIPSVARTLNNPKWCIGARATPSAAWSTTGLLASVGIAGASNSAYLGMSVTGGTNILFAVFNGVAARKYVLFSSLDAGWSGEHKVVGCNNGGTLALYRDGVSVGTVGDVGDGVIATMPATVYIGNHYSTNQFQGSIKKVCQASTLAACMKALQ